MPTRQAQESGWQLAGDSAEAYERHLVPAFFTEMADQLLDAAGLSAGERVLDVGCGTGIVIRRAAPRTGPNGTLVGLDVNETMLRVARRASAGFAPAIEYRKGDAAALPFPDASFDLVTCQQVLQFLAEPAKALREAHRVLARGGRAAIAVLRPIRYSPAYVPLAEALERHAGREAGAMMRSPFPDWDRERLRSAVAAGGFAEVRVRTLIVRVRFPTAARMLQAEASSSPLAAPLGSLSVGARDALVREVEASLAEFEDDDGLVFPMQTYLALARGRRQLGGRQAEPTSPARRSSPS